MTTTQVGQALDLIERMEHGEASTSRLFSGDGVRFKSRSANPTYQQDLLYVMDLYERTLNGSRRAALDLTESLSRSDFSYLFADVIDRQMLAAYAIEEVQWGSWAKRGRVRDFRTVKRFTLDGGNARLSKVKELAPYQARAVSDGAYTYNVDKYGGEIPISWETLVNDDLDALADLPIRLGQAARRTEEYFATDLFAGSTGPDGTFFSTANKNVINSTTAGTGAPTNPPLTIQALQYAYQVLASQVDTTGNPISVSAVTLVVPPALKVIANNIVNATEIRAASGGGDGTGNDQLVSANWMRNELTVTVNHWLPIISTTNGNTSWYLFANPNAGRPAMEVGFLIGHEAPELWIKAPDAMRVGGGMVAPEEGDFVHDGIRYRVRYVLGGTTMDPKAALGSNGSGS